MDTRQEKDLRTLESIGAIYCKAHHRDAPKDDASLCPSCRAAIDNTMERTLSCPYGHEGNCEDCNIKCNRGEQQRRIREIMAYAAPRMFVRHPIMAARYVRKKLTAKRR